MKKLGIGILCICAFLLVGCGNAKTEEKNLGIVEKATIEVLIKLFNDNINDNSGLAFIDIDNPKVENGNYRYESEEGVYVTVTPEKQEAKDKDIVKSM